MLLISLGDIDREYDQYVRPSIFMLSSFVLIEELELRKSLYFFLLFATTLIFNPLYHQWFEMEIMRLIIYVTVSVVFLLKTAKDSLLLIQSDRGFNQAF
jgi:Ca2+/Na+ antiporter